MSEFLEVVGVCFLFGCAIAAMTAPVVFMLIVIAWMFGG